MKFWYVVRYPVPHTFTVGICEIIFTEREKGISQRQYKWRLQSLLCISDVWELYRSSQRKQLEESQGTARDAIIAVWRHVSPLRGKGWVIDNWRLVRTYVGILEYQLEWVLGCFRYFLLYPYNYNCELYMFDKPIVVKLICYCVECEPYKLSIFLISMNWWNKVRRNLEWDIDFVFSLFSCFLGFFI